MDYCVTVLQKVLLLSYVMSWPVVLAYPETAQHSIITVLYGKTIVQTLGKTTVQIQGKTTVETLGKTTVAKWQTGRATLIEPY